MQLSGHHNLQSVNNYYSTLSKEQQKNMIVVDFEQQFSPTKHSAYS